MSEELKPCPHCGNVPPLQVPTRLDGVQIELIACLHCGTRLYGMSRADAARVWNMRHDPNPWRYPSRGELPEKEGGEYLMTNHSGSQCVVNRSYIHRYALDIRAWKELDEPAPGLEDTPPLVEPTPNQ